MFQKAIILFFSVAIGVLLCEAGARFVLNAADYLSPQVDNDSVLGITISPNSSGFDEWGFRNKEVPANVDVLAVGDSHTYGNTARMDDAWPSVVERETGLKVYNLGLGGYGPNQYFHLLTTKGLRLHPKWVVCGLYMGDDFENAFLITYGLEHWSFLRQSRWDDVNANIWASTEPPVWGSSLRNWLSEHSMVYRIVFHGPFMAMVKEAVRFRQAAAEGDPYTTTLIVEDQHIREAFRPIGMAERLDLKSPAVKEGMRVTFHLLKEMDKACKQEGCKFVVVIIPTKETVFSDFLEHKPAVHLHEAIDRLIANERSARQVVFQFLTDEGILFLDTLPALKHSVDSQLYAQTTRDMHPGKNGYKVIGQAVASYLSSQTVALLGK